MIVLAPLDGVTLPLTEVPDPVFAQSLVGPGVAIAPHGTDQVVTAPIAGKLFKLKPHAFVVLNGERAVLVHLGIDTVHLGGDGFELLAVEGQEVEAGDPVVRWSPSRVAAAGLSPICPIVALEATADAIEQGAEGDISAGAALFTWRDNA